MAEARDWMTGAREPWRSRVFYIPAARPLMWLMARLGFTANMATALSILFSLAGLLMWLTLDLLWVVAGVVLIQVAVVLDHVDGGLARWRGGGSPGGLYFDKMALEVLFQIALFSVVPLVVWRQTGDVFWIAVAFVLGWTKAVLVAGYMLRLALTEHEAAPGEGGPGPAERFSVLRLAMGFFWDSNRAANLVCVLLLVDVLLMTGALLPMEFVGYAWTLLAVYAAAAAVLLLVSLVRDLWSNSKQPRPAEMEPFR